MPDDRTELKTLTVPTPEQAPSFEVTQEQLHETTHNEIAEPGLHVETPQPEHNVITLPTREVAAAPRVERDPTVAAIDAILEEGLGKFVDDMQVNDRTKFIAAGEELTVYIAKELAAKHPHYGRTLDAITRWLHMIPMLNKEFLRQEAKRKNDQVMMFEERREQQSALAA